MTQENIADAKSALSYDLTDGYSWCIELDNC